MLFQAFSKSIMKQRTARISCLQDTVPKKHLRKNTFKDAILKVFLKFIIITSHLPHAFFFFEVARQSFQNWTKNANTFKPGLRLTNFSVSHTGHPLQYSQNSSHYKEFTSIYQGRKQFLFKQCNISQCISSLFRRQFIISIVSL